MAMLARHRVLQLLVFLAAWRADMAGAADLHSSDSAGHASTDPAACADRYRESSGVGAATGGWWQLLLPPENSVWRVRASAIGATALISIAPIFILPLVPMPTPNAPGSAGAQQPALLCFAAGSMLGDVFLHILPHTLGGGHAHAESRGHSGPEDAPHDHDHDHGHAEHRHDNEHTSHAEDAHAHHSHIDSDGDASHGGHHEHAHPESDSHEHGHGHAHDADELLGGLSVLGGFGAFFLVEKLVRGGHPKGAAAHPHAHAHGGHAGVDKAVTAGVTEPAGSRDQGNPASAVGLPPSQSGAALSGRRARSRARRRNVSPGTADLALAPSDARSDTEPPSAAGSITATHAARSGDQLIAGYLNLAADAAHNFTDGLMLGAAFSTSWELGVSTTVACLAHEVPHEICDVAVLMQAGFSKWRAIRAQLSTALGALLGAVIALATGRAEANLLLGFTAGGFIYVASVDILPSVLQAHSTPMQTLWQVAALAGGVGAMVAVTALEA
jgi:zinc transporter 7